MLIQGQELPHMGLQWVSRVQVILLWRRVNDMRYNNLGAELVLLLSAPFPDPVGQRGSPTCRCHKLGALEPVTSEAAD